TTDTYTLSYTTLFRSLCAKLLEYFAQRIVFERRSSFRRGTCGLRRLFGRFGFGKLRRKLANSELINFTGQLREKLIGGKRRLGRSEEHTSELQSRFDL